MNRIISIAILALWLGSTLIFISELMEINSRLAKVETTASVLMAGYRIDRMAKEQKEEEVRNNINP
jgi:hypothetical protein